MKNLTIVKLSESAVRNMGIRNWPVWEKEVSAFEWQYESDEECLILEGEVEVKTTEGDFLIKKGDFVTFKKGLQCTWNIKSPIRKHYNFPG